MSKLENGRSSAISDSSRLRDSKPAPRGDRPAAEDAPRSQPADPPRGEHVVLSPTVALRQPRRFEDDPSVCSVLDGINFCPWAPELCFDAELTPPSAARPGLPRTPGISLLDRTKGEFDLICRLQDLPLETWVRLTDRQGRHVPFDLYVAAHSAQLFVRWDVPGAPARPSTWWPPDYLPPGLRHPVTPPWPPPSGGAPRPTGGLTDSGADAPRWAASPGLTDSGADAPRWGAALRVGLAALAGLTGATARRRAKTRRPLR